MNTIHKYIELFELTTGINCKASRPYDLEDLPFFIKKHFEIFTIYMIQKSFVVILPKTRDIKLTYNAFRIITNKYAKENIALFINNPRVYEKRFYIKHRIPFFSTNGEMFLLFMGINIRPSFKSKFSEKLSTTAQKIFVFLFYIEKYYEKNERGHTIIDDFFHKTNDGIIFKSGKHFIDNFQKTLGINNRVTLSRGLRELANQSIIKIHGNTKNRLYTLEESSHNLFIKNKERLSTPLELKNYSIDSDLYKTILDSQYNSLTNDTIIIGDSALSKISMLSPNNKLEIGISKNIKKWKTIIREFEDKDNYIYDNLTNKYDIRFTKYNLLEFNKLYRQLIDPKYPNDILDPLNLYLSVYNTKNERIVGIANEIINKII